MASGSAGLRAVTLTSAAVIAALAVHTLVPGWGFTADVDPSDHVPHVFLVGSFGALVVAARTTRRWGVAWAVIVGVVSAALLPVQYLAGRELEPDQRVALFFGPPALLLSALLGGLLGASWVRSERGQ